MALNVVNETSAAHLNAARLAGTGWLNRISTVTAVLIAIAVMVNTYSYTIVASNPLIQSDVWHFLDSFLGRFIQYGFVFADLFAQTNARDTNLPLQKLILFFHTRFFGMDFRVEAMFGVASGIILVLVLARACVAQPFKRWGTAEAWLLASLTLSLLSLNSTNVYTWPLATLWFMPVLLGALYMWAVFSAPDKYVLLVLASLLLGVALDEVAYPVYLATLGALILAPQWRTRRQLLSVGVLGAAGIAASRLFYGLIARAPVSGGPAGDSFGASIANLLEPGIWQAVLLPLSDSVVHESNAVPIFGANGGQWVTAIGIVLLLAHAWFWWRAVFGFRHATPPAARIVTLMAAAMMLLYYALVAGIVIQRVPVFGFEYLHQPRYVLFYQLNLAALCMLVYRDWRHALAARARSPVNAIALATILSLAWLQFHLSVLAWEHAKYVSGYLAGTAQTMGVLAADPTAEIECPDIMNICKFPPAKRQELMDRLSRHKLNLFSPAFQSFHRLYPDPAPREAD